MTFLKTIFENNHRISLDEWRNIFNVPQTWITDFTLRECFCKMDDLDQLSEIELVGCDYLTDQGVVWMCKYLQKCTALEKISFRSCCKITVNSVRAIEQCNKECFIELKNNKSIDFPKETENVPLVICPTPSVDINDILTIMKNVDHPVHVFNYGHQVDPVHLLMPEHPDHVWIIVTGNVEDAVTYIAEVVSVFVSSEVPRIRKSNDIDPTEGGTNNLNKSCQLHTEFTVACWDANDDKCYQELMNMKWDELLENNIKKLKAFIDHQTQTLSNRFDISGFIQISEAERQLERLEEFIAMNGHQESGRRTISILDLTNPVRKKDIGNLINLMRSKLKKDVTAFVSPSWYHTFTMESQEMSKIFFTHTSRIISRLSSKEMKLCSPNSGSSSESVDKFLYQLATKANTKANYKCPGVDKNTKVWTKLSLSILFDAQNIHGIYRKHWIQMLMELGLMVHVPCRRSSSDDEPYYYIPIWELDNEEIANSKLSAYMCQHSNDELKIEVKYSKVCQNISSIFPQLLLDIISIGHLQLLSLWAIVIHVNGGIELIIKRDVEAITISAYMSHSKISDRSEIKTINLNCYLWSVIHLCTDAMEAILNVQLIVATKEIRSQSKEEPLNYSVCYNHRWTNESCNINVCTLCGNCSSKQGINCPYNRFIGPERGHCQCKSYGSSCQDCGICKSCADKHWKNHCLANPGLDISITEKNNKDSLSEINFALSSVITFELKTEKSRLFVGLLRHGGDEIIDILGVSTKCGDRDPKITNIPILTMDEVGYSSFSIGFSEVFPKIKAEETETDCKYRECINVDFNESFRLLTSLNENGIFVGQYPLSKDKKQFSIEVIAVSYFDIIVVGLVSDYEDVSNMSETASLYVGYGSSGDVLYSNELQKTDYAYNEIGSVIEVSILYEDTGTRVVILKNNGSEMWRNKIKMNRDIYPFVKICSRYCQIKLGEDSLWLTEKPTTTTDDSITMGEIMFSPKSTLKVANIDTSVLHLSSKSSDIKSVEFEMKGPESYLKEIFSVNGFPVKKMNSIKWSIEIDKSTKKNQIVSFAFLFENNDRIKECTIIASVTMTNKTVLSSSFHLTKELKPIRLVEVEEPGSASTFPPHLMSITGDGHTRHYYITKGDYDLVIKGDTNDFYIRALNMKHLCIESPLRKSTSCINETANNSNFNRSLLSLGSLYWDRTTKIIKNIETSLLKKAPFANEQSISDYRCSTYRGMTLCLLNFVSMYRQSSRQIQQFCGVINLPFNTRSDLSDRSDFLWSHSYSGLLNNVNITAYSYIEPDWNEIEDIPTEMCIGLYIISTETIKEKEALKFAHLEKSLLDGNTQFLFETGHSKKLSTLINQSLFSSNEVLNLVYIILEKITSFMLLNNLYTDKSTSQVFETDQNNYEPLRCTDNLYSVNFDDYEIKNIRKMVLFKYGKYVTKVCFTGKKIKIIPKEIFLLFPNLSWLELKGMFRIREIPESIYGLTELKTLQIYDCGIVDMPQVWKFKRLRNLKISNCPISRGLSDETKTNKLKFVDLENLPLSQFPKLLFCDSLTKISLYIPGIQTIPDEIKMLVHLKTLIIRGSKLYYHLFDGRIEPKTLCIKSNLWPYTEVEHFELAQTDDSVASVQSNVDIFINVPRIGSGYTESIDTLLYGGFPMALLKLSSLTFLTISFQAIRRVPKEIEMLVNLKYIDLTYNHLLKYIAAEISYIKSFQTIIVKHCPALEEPPAKVISSGSATILTYLRHLLKEKIICNRVKLMFVGLGGAGKTSLLNALKSQRSIMSEEDAVLTDGIDIDTFTAKVSDKESIEFSTWDFAGQDVYYNTHQFFLSPNAIYVLVWSVRQGLEFADLDFWLSSIGIHAKKAPIFVVGTHCDQVRVNKTSFDKFKEQYPQIVEFYLIDSKTGTGISTLRDEILKKGLSMPHLKVPIPLSILNLEKAIIKRRRVENFIEFEEFVKLCSDENIIESESKNVLTILHDFGSVQYFDTPLLNKYIVINPQWLSKIMSDVVSVSNINIIDGIFYHKDMNLVWTGFESDVHKWMMNLTEKFDLTYPDPTDDANVVPCLLPKKDKEIQWPIFPKDCDWKYFQIHYIFKFLPAGLFNRIQVRLFDFTDTKDIWRDGTYFKKNDHHVLMKRESKTMLSVRAIGVRPINVLAMVDEVIRSLIQTFSGDIKVEMKMACPDCVERGEAKSTVATQYWSEPKMIKLSKVMEALEQKVEYIQCSKFHLNSLMSLKNNSPESPSNERFIQNIFSQLLYVEALANSDDMVVVILYSSKSSSPDINRIKDLISENNLTCKEINENSNTMLKWKRFVESCSLCIIILSETFVEISEMDEILNYVKLLKKDFLVIVTERNQIEKLNWTHGLYFNGIYVKLIESDGVVEFKYNEIRSTIQRYATGTTKSKKNYYDCFISYCRSNSQDAVNKGTKRIKGADPRNLEKYLSNHGISCWIDYNELVSNLGLGEQLSHGLYNSKMMIACVSREYNDSEYCKMELRFMVETLRRPVLYVIVGSNFHKKKTTEVDFLMLKKNKITMDFSKNREVTKKKLLKKVESILAKCPSVDKEKKLTRQPNIYTPLNEQVELLFRQFLNQLISYSEEHCPRLVALDYAQDQDTTDNTNIRLQLRVICENEGGWHVVDDYDLIKIEDEDILLKDCALYLYMLYQVLKTHNPGLRGLKYKDNGIIAKVTPVIQSLQIHDLKESYQRLVRYYMELDPELSKCSLKRYSLASGRELWMCDEHAACHKRCRLLERDARSQDSLINTVDECDFEILRQLILKAPEEERKYKDSFKSILEADERCMKDLA